MEMLFLVQNVKITFGEACLFAIFSILVVFLILIFITLIISLMKKLKLEDKKVEEKNVVKPISQPTIKKQTKLEDIKDDDMMVAVLVATIEGF